MQIFADLEWAQTRPRLQEWASGAGYPFCDIRAIHQLPVSTESFKRSVLISLEDDVPNLQKLRDNHGILAVMPIRMGYEEEDIERSIAYLEKIAKLPSSTNSLVLDGHVRNGEEIHHAFERSEERWKAIDDLGEYIGSKEVFESLPDIAKTIASELLTNAFYNAPQDQNGQPLQPSRSEGVHLVPPRRVEMSYGDDGNHLWLRVSDPFGTFSREKLLKHLLSCADRDQLVVRDGVGGAGIGLFMVFKWASELLFVFEPGQETFVLVKLLKTKRMKIFDNQRAIFEVIQKPARSEQSRH